MELREYKEKKEKVIEAVQFIRSKIKDEDTIKFLDEKIKSLEEHKFVISVFGHFSNGKSTFLNALMGFGEEILVEDELASTATITRLRYPNSESLKNKAKIVFNDGTVRVVEFSEIKNYSARNNQINVEYDIGEVILYLESEILKDGVEIVDTPGFNSTHSIHTDIAKAHVANSDASIFIFAYDMPGSKTEFDFLKQVNDKMNRIFLVLNKIDKENKTENNIENTIDDLKCKINSAGADVKSKIVYPISARLEKEGIAEGNSHKREIANVLEFKKKLADYLTSEDNIRDRLEAPIKSILSRLNECREIKKEHLGIYSSESDKLEQDIKRAKIELEELENDLKERKKSIKRDVKTEINNAKSCIEQKVEELGTKINDNLEYIKSSFSLKTMDFNNMTDTMINDIKNEINETQRNLITEIGKVIDLNIDSQLDFDMLKSTIVNAIEVKLNLDGKSVFSIDEIDNSYVNDIDEKIKNLKEELKEKKEEWERLNRESGKNEELRRIIEFNRQALNKLNDEKKERLSNIGEGQAHWSKIGKEELVSRGGFFGKIADFCDGGKSVTTYTDVLDEREIEYKRGRKAEVEKDCQEEIKVKEKLVKDTESKVTGDKSVEIFRDEAKINYNKALGNFCDEEMKLQKERFGREQEIVSINLRKYKKSIKEYISNLAEQTKTSFDMNASIINKTVELSLISLERKIEAKNETVTNLIFAGKISPEELDMKINEISEEIVALNKSIDNMRVLREGVI